MTGNLGQATGPNFGYGGGNYLADGRPFAIYRDCASDQGLGHAMWVSLPITPPPASAAGLSGEALSDWYLWNSPEKWRWKEETAVWLPTMVIPQQSGSTKYAAIPTLAVSGGHSLVTSPSIYNNFQGSILVIGSHSGAPCIMRHVGTATFGDFVPSSPLASVKALPWILDSTHTVPPAINSTGMYDDTAGGANLGGNILALAEPSPGFIIGSLYGRKNGAGSAKAGSAFICSTDDGQTWNFRSYGQDGSDLTPLNNVLEPVVIPRRSHGDLYVMHRMGDDTRAFQTSQDMGLTWGPWTSLADQFPGGTSGFPWVHEAPNGDGTYTMFHFVRPPDFGRILLAYASTDGGVTWPHGPVVASPGTGTLIGAPPQWWLDGGGGLAGQSTYGQTVNKQIRIPGVRDGIIGMWFSFSNQTGAAIDGIAAASTMYYQELVLPA